MHHDKRYKSSGIKPIPLMISNILSNGTLYQFCLLDGVCVIGGILTGPTSAASFWKPIIVHHSCSVAGAVFPEVTHDVIPNSTPCSDSTPMNTFLMIAD